jgi:hypothetical protein
MDTVKITENRINQQVKDVLTKEKLEDLYVRQKLSVRQIAQMAGCGESWVDNLRRRYIPVVERYMRHGLPDDLTMQQKELLVGNLLGDGRTVNKGSHAHFTFTQEIKKAGYVRWLANRYRPFVTPKKCVVASRCTMLQGKPYYFKTINFVTYTHPAIDAIHNKFYPTSKKIVPIDIIEQFFSPLSLAVWFADDGSTCEKEKHCINTMFATDCFSLDENLWLRDFLQRKFNISCTINQHDGNHRLRVAAESREIFYNLISPVLLTVPCLIYKLPKQFRHLESSQTIRSTEDKTSEDIVDGLHCTTSTL